MDAALLQNQKNKIMKKIFIIDIIINSLFQINQNYVF